MITNRQFEIVEVPEKKCFKIHVVIDEEISPGDLLKRIEQVDKNLEDMKKEMESLPVQVEARTKYLKDNLNLFLQEWEKLKDHRPKASGWKALEDKQNERKGIDKQGSGTDKDGEDTNSPDYTI